jgi:hypothetical protein
MNSEFVKKMLRAEKLRYEAVKEILPDRLRQKIDSFEADVYNLIKDVALDLIKEGINEEKKEDPLTENKKTRQVKVDFS